METAIAVASGPSPVTVGGLVRRTFSVWWKNLVPFALLAVIVKLPVLALGFWAGFYGAKQGTGEVASKLAHSDWAWKGLVFVGVTALLTMLILVYVQIAALTYGAIQHLAGRKITFGELLRAGSRRAWPVFLAGLQSGILILVGTLLLVVPGIIIACGVAVAIPVVVAEAKGAGQAISRSFALTKGRRFTIFAAFLVMMVANIAFSKAAENLPGMLPFASLGVAASLAVTTVGFVGQAIVEPLMTLFPAVAYHDLRIEKEGVDTAELAKVFE